jgi:5'-nucleotidase
MTPAPRSGLLTFLRFAALLLLGGCHSLAEQRVEAQPMRISLIAFNDFHGNLQAPGSWKITDPADVSRTLAVPAGGAAYLATMLRQLKAQNPLNAVVAAGDLIGASPLDSALFHDEPSIDVLNEMGLEFSAAGNHEFDDGSAELLRMQNGGCFPGGTPGQDTCIDGSFAGAKFSYMGANVIDLYAHKPLLPAFGTKTFEQNGHKVTVGFVGLSLKGTPGLISPTVAKGLRFDDEAIVANALVPVLRQHGAQVLVILIHQGGAISGRYDDPACPGLSGEILPILQGLDRAYQVVISGHTHNAYVCSVDGRLLTSAGSFGRLVTDIELQVDPAAGVLRSASAANRVVVNDRQPVPEGVAVLTPDPAVNGILARYGAVTGRLTGRVVGRITGDFSNQPGPNGESALGQVVADAQFEATRSAGAQFALTNPAGVRQSLDYAAGPDRRPGEVTYGQVAAAQPFGNALVTMTLSGAELLQALNQQWGEQTHILPVSAQLSYDWMLVDGHGQVVADSLRIAGAPLQLNRDYRFTVNEFLANGGDGFTVFKTLGRDRVGGGLDAQALEQYLHTHSPLSPATTPRLRRLAP